MTPAAAELLILMVTEAPCLAVVKLKALKLSLSTTGTVQKIEFRDRSTWFQPSGDAGAALDDLIRQAEEACAALSGRPSRMAITLGGGPRRGRPWGY